MFFVVDDVYGPFLLTLNWYPDILKVQNKKHASKDAGEMVYLNNTLGAAKY